MVNEHLSGSSRERVNELQSNLSLYLNLNMLIWHICIRI